MKENSNQTNPQKYSYLKNFIFSNQRVGRLGHLYLMLFYFEALFAYALTLGFMKGVAEGLSAHLHLSSSYFSHLGALIVFFTALLVFAAGTVHTHIRRLWDLNYRGWFLLLSIVPLVNLVLLIVIYFFKGTNGENRFGEEKCKLSKSIHLSIVIPLIILSVIIGAMFYCLPPHA